MSSMPLLLLYQHDSSRGTQHGPPHLLTATACAGRTRSMENLNLRADAGRKQSFCSSHRSYLSTRAIIK